MTSPLPSRPLRRPVASTAARWLLAASAATLGGVAAAHVSLPPGGAAAGSVHEAAFRVGHACRGATVTTALRIGLPAGVRLVEARPRAGWSVTTSAEAVTWTAGGREAALGDRDRTPFVLKLALPPQPGPVWFPVLQTCDQGTADWSQRPAGDGDTPAFPAVRLDLLPAGVAAVDVRDAWARATVPGQTAGGVFARLTAPAGARLVGGSTPVAERVEVHEMRMDGDVMRMRALDDGLALPPGDTRDLAPGGHHLMLLGLRRPLAAGSTVPLELRFVDAEGRTVRRTVEVPVRAGPPGGGATGGGHAHH